MLYSTLVSNFPIMDLTKDKKKTSYVALLYIIAFKSMKHSFPFHILQDQQLKIKKVMLQHLQTLISVQKLWAVTLK